MSKLKKTLVHIIIHLVFILFLIFLLLFLPQFSGWYLFLFYFVSLLYVMYDTQYFVISLCVCNIDFGLPVAGQVHVSYYSVFKTETCLGLVHDHCHICINC